MKKIVLATLICFITIWVIQAQAAPIPPGQSVGATTETVEKMKEQQALNKRLKSPRPKAKVEGKEKVVPSEVGNETGKSDEGILEK